MIVPPFLSVEHRRSLAPAAAFERDERRRLYPERIRVGKIECGDAEADFDAWQEIVLWCETGPLGSLYLQPMVLAAARALQAGESAVSKAPGDQARVARRDGVAAIHEALSRYQTWLAETNAALRARARPRQAA